MSEKKAIIVTESCPYCAQLKAYLKQKGLLDKVQFIDASTKEGYAFARQHGVTGVPECVVITEKGKQVRICSEQEFQEVLKEG